MRCARRATSVMWTWRRTGRARSPARTRSDSIPRRIQSHCGTRRAAAKASRSEPSKPRSGSRAKKVFTSSATYFLLRRFGRRHMFTGCGTAMVTPFQENGSLDEATLRKLVRRQIDQGIDFLVPCGTTGESPTLSRDEHLRVVAITIEEAARNVPVLAV